MVRIGGKWLNLKELLIRFAPEFILIIYLLLFFVVKNPSNPHDRVIISDGKSYYAYLTTAFIYHDLNYNFVEYYESKYYPDHPSIFKEFRYTFKEQIVNKAFPGLAFLLLPFFIVAHLIALLFGLPADGYSLIYQYFMGFAALFYFWAGLRYTKKLLTASGFNQKVAAVILVLIAFATNIIYYTLKEGLMTHVYNFFLLATFLYYLKDFTKNHKANSLIIAALVYGLIVSVRPTNALFALLIPFVLGSSASVKSLFNTLFAEKRLLLKVVAAGLVFPIITMIIWYLHSGYWFVWSYGDEGFDFAKFNFLKILFSFNKGWFVYTPLALFSMTALIWFFRNQFYRFLWLTVFWILFIYVASSWWVWTYTSNFGLRTFIDTYALIALMLGYVWLLIRDSKILIVFAKILGIALIVLNSLQFYQHYTYVFPPGEITSSIYKESFFRLKPKPKVYYPEGYITSRHTFYNDFEKRYGWANEESITDEKAYEGNFSSKTGLSGVYSIGLWQSLDSCFTTEYNRIRVCSWIFSDKAKSSGVLVIQLEKDNEEVFYKPFFMKDYSRKNKWAYMEVAIAVPDTLQDVDYLKVYFYNQYNTEDFFVDNLKVEVLSLSIDY